MGAWSSSLLKNLIRNGFSASFCDFRSARGHFRRQLQLWEASRQRDHCNSGPTHHPTACTWRVLSRQRLYAAPVKWRWLEKGGWVVTFTRAAYNLCRVRNLAVQAVRRGGGSALQWS